MKKFAYRRAYSVAEAVESGGSSGVHFIAGGTNLIDLMKENVERPDRLIDITGLPLDQIRATQNDGLSLAGCCPTPYEA